MVAGHWAGEEYYAVSVTATGGGGERGRGDEGVEKVRRE